VSQEITAISKPASRRILTLDLLRGYFLFDMVLNHLNYWPNGLDWVSARGQLFVSGAEGFFLISGIVLGIVRGRKLIDKPLRVPTKLLLKRSWQLYVTYVFSVLFFTFFGWWVFMNNPGLKFGIAPSDTPLLPLLWNTLTFQYIYGWADYLRLYVLFILVSPLAVWLLRQGKWWIVMGASVLIWALVPRPLYPDNVWLQPYHWQLLFFGGLTLGYHWDDVRERWLRIRAHTRKIIIGSIVSATVVVIAANIFLAFGGYLGNSIYDIVAPLRDTLSKPFDKENLSVYRLIYTSMCFISGFWLFNKFEPFIKKYFGWILLPFGTNSLYVYTVQAFLVFFVQMIVPSGGSTVLINILLSYATLALIWLMIRYEILFKIIPR